MNLTFFLKSSYQGNLITSLIFNPRANIKGLFPEKTIKKIHSRKSKLTPLIQFNELDNNFKQKT